MPHNVPIVIQNNYNYIDTINNSWSQYIKAAEHLTNQLHTNIQGHIR